MSYKIQHVVLSYAHDSLYEVSLLNTIMEFIKVLLQHGTIKEAKLLNSAHKAAANPEIGVTITHKAAYHVIKDCASIASKYIPLMVFGAYADPFETLRGKFSRKSIQELVTKAAEDVAYDQLITVIVDRATKMKLMEAPKPTTKEIKFEEDAADPYGDYGCMVQDDAPVIISSPTTDAMVDTLVKLFAA
jgi:hypothetical protein